MKMALKRFALTLLICSLVFGALSGSALASSIYATGGDSYIRSQPNLSGMQLGLLPDGASATYLGDSSVDNRGVTWYYISYRGTTGWVSSKYTSPVNEYYYNSYDYDVLFAVGGDSYIRRLPSLSGGQLGLFPEGATASYLGDSAVDERGVTWYYISYRGTTGWVSSKYTAFSGGYSYGSYVVAVDGGSYIRSSASTDAHDLGTLPKGAVAVYLGETRVDMNGREWYKIRYNGITGWVSARYTQLQ